METNIEAAINLNRKDLIFRVINLIWGGRDLRRN